ncbi:alpha/beta hydrolase [Rhizobium calliandrae]|uniref:Alpha/beta hydrolase n=1 Tax=Rhizobium calliandrae TaxID=1312182 RepID=A0ABT7KDY8_9HYPH|nr:alpha/beta hydrolase [Rhizobium calliandrae]MDL2406839.1 alpha/beta hydrolase [Rhizobium calliandrae]
MAHSRFAKLSKVKLHFVEEGVGGAEVVILLHGWPHTSHTWRHVIPQLSRAYRVIAPDMRGLGDSSRPAHGYDNGTVANDIIELIDLLGIDTFYLVGHDWGGPVAFAATLLARERVKKLALVDAVLAGDGRVAGSGQGGARWHHLFHRTPHLPEALTAGQESIYLSWFYDEYSERAGAVGPEDIAEYVRCYSQPGAMRCGFEYYRTIEESAAFVTGHIERGGKPTLPVLSVAGGAGRGRATEAQDSIGKLVNKLDAHIISDCGHLVPEEAPDELSALLLSFFKD